MKKFLKIGHRGAKGHLAENTLESIEIALRQKVDAIEIDVHKCKTGELVVIHDFTLDRTTTGSGEVHKKTLQEIKSYKAEGKYEIPTLEEVLNLIEGKCKINIELKGTNTAAEAYKIINRYISERNWSYEDFIVSSFQKNELFEVNNLDPNIPIGILSKASVDEAMEWGKKLNAFAIHPSAGIISRENIKQMKDAGFKVFVWTVNSLEEIERMKSFEVDGIISDYPDRL